MEISLPTRASRFAKLQFFRDRNCLQLSLAVQLFAFSTQPEEIDLDEKLCLKHSTLTNARWLEIRSDAGISILVRGPRAPFGSGAEMDMKIVNQFVTGCWSGASGDFKGAMPQGANV